MKILIISDGQFGDRAADHIKNKFQNTKICYIEEIDQKKLIDDYEFDPTIESEILESDLIISYIRHPDIVFDLCFYKKPTIVAIFSGLGLLQQIHDVNKNVIMPSSMCSLEPNTGIKMIDEFLSHFGKPIYQITVDKEKNIITNISVTTESPCGATARSLRFLFGKEIKPQNFDLFLTNIMQECRESVAYWFSKVDQAGNAIFNHLIPLIDNLKIQIPSLFEKGTEMDEYLKSKLG